MKLSSHHFSEGINGMWPNLDLIRLLRVISKEQGIPLFKLVETSQTSHPLHLIQTINDKFYQFLMTLLRTASCRSSGNHGIFLR